jgi:hypothetical protein
MGEPHDDDTGDRPLNERILDLLVFVPAGFATSVMEELPKLAVRGREHLEVRVSSARSVGEFVVKASHDELVRRSERLLHRDRSASDRAAAPHTDESAPAAAGPTGVVPDPSPVAPTGVVSDPSPTGPVPSPVESVPAPAAPTTGNGHVPPVATLAIPGFDTLSASQVVQRLDGLTRGQLVAVRAYESSTRGRRTILSRVDQLLDERS